MLRLLADENIDNAVLRGLRSRTPIEIVRVQDVGLRTRADELVLQWAGENDRILLTNDLATIPAIAFSRIATGLPMPGVFVWSRRVGHAEIIEEFRLLDECSEQWEWNGRVVFLPL